MSLKSRNKLSTFCLAMHIEYEISFLGQTVVLSSIRIAVEGPFRTKLLEPHNAINLFCFLRARRVVCEL